MATLLDNGFNISTLTATGGAGKSYITTHDLALNRLVKYNYGLVTNLPLHVERIAEFVAKERGCKPEEVSSRIEIIPEEKLRRWREGDGGPWEYAEHFKKGPCDLIIDEAHEFCKRGMQDEEWRTFLGEARHPPYSLQRVQFLTQSVKKVAVPIEQHAAIRYRLEKGDLRRGLLGFSMGDFYQVLASITGEYTPFIYRIEEIKGGEEKWTKNAEDAFIFRKDIQALYDSHSDAGGTSTAKDATFQPQEFERRPRVFPAKRDYYADGKEVWTAPTWLWAFLHNPAATGKILMIVAAFLFFSCGGVAWSINTAMGYMRHATQSIAASTIPGSKKPTSGGANPAEPDKPCGCEASEAELAEKTEQIRRLTEEINNSGALGAISPRFVQFRGGVITDLRGVITDGRYEGQTVEEIDFDGRRARLSDAGWVRLGAEPPETDDADVRGPLPGTQSGSGTRVASRPAAGDRTGDAGDEGTSTR